MSQAEMQVCEECSANVYPEHIANRRAGLHAGKLLCPVCYEEKTRVAPAAQATAGGANGPGQAEQQGAGTSFSAARSSKIRTGGSGSMIGASQSAVADDSQLTRTLRDTGKGATRCRTFHAKLNENAIAYMNEQINDWVDHHPEVEIKFANTTVGVFEGKHADPNLIITVFY